MATTLDLVSGELDYGSTHDEDLVVPFRKPPSRLWKTKKVVIGIIMGVTAVVVLAGAGLAQTGQLFPPTRPRTMCLILRTIIRLSTFVPAVIDSARLFSI